MRHATARLEDGYYCITVANHRLITVIRFVVKGYTHPWKFFTNKLRLVLHACEILFSRIVCYSMIGKNKQGPRKNTPPLVRSTSDLTRHRTQNFHGGCVVSSASHCAVSAISLVRAALTKPVGIGPIWPVTGGNRSGPVSVWAGIRPKIKIQIWIQKNKKFLKIL